MSLAGVFLIAIGVTAIIIIFLQTKGLIAQERALEKIIAVDSKCNACSCFHEVVSQDKVLSKLRRLQLKEQRPTN